MKIKSHLNFNTSLFAPHKKATEGGKILIGSAQPDYINIPAGATLELADAEWAKYSDTETAKLWLEKGILEITEAPVLTEEEQEAADAAELAEVEARAAELAAKKSKKTTSKTTKES